MTNTMRLWNPCLARRERLAAIGITTGLAALVWRTTIDVTIVELVARRTVAR